MKRNKPDNITLLLIVFILTGVVTIYITGTKIVEGTQAIDETKLEIQSEYIRRERYQELLESYQTLKQQGALEEIDSVLPSADNFVEVIEELESIALLSNNQIQMRLGEAKLTSQGIELSTEDLVQSAIISEGGYDRIQIEVSLRGKYADLEQFLHLFYQAKYYLNITAMNANRLSTDAGAYIDTFFTIDVFVQTVIYN